MRRRSISAALLLLVLAALACNAPSSEDTMPTESTATPIVPSDDGETPDDGSDEPTEESSPTPTETAIPTPSPTITPTATSTPFPTATPEPVSTGPLDFVPPSWPENYQPLSNGNMQVTLRIQISGGAPPFVVYHDETIAVEETAERDVNIVFEHGGCSAIVHTITVESADGQRVAHDYWIRPPWCITPES